MSIVALDHVSLLVHVRADASFAEVQAVLARDGLTLDATYDGTIGRWLEQGAPGSRNAWLDPADHVIAGWTGRVNGKTFEIRPAPRRATGPDLLCLVLGCEGRFIKMESVWLRVHRLGVARPTTEHFAGDAAPVNDGERALFDAIASNVIESDP